jgi:phosphatidylserine decarboxylase
MSNLSSMFVPINRAGWPFIAGFVLMGIVLGWWWFPAGLIAGTIAVAFVWFFRDPQRVTPCRIGLVVSPADGMVVVAGLAVPPLELGLGNEPHPCISIFLSLLDVHVNRVASDGIVLRKVRTPGKFYNAATLDAAESNERISVAIQLPDGRSLAMVQVAGLIARRISCELQPGQVVKAGERFGMIRFGSRAEVYLPSGVAPLVVIGQRVIAGETVIADLQSTETARHGEIR